MIVTCGKCGAVHDDEATCLSEPGCRHQVRIGAWGVAELKAHLSALVDGLSADLSTTGDTCSPLEVALEIITGELQTFLLVGRLGHLDPPRTDGKIAWAVLQRLSENPEVNEQLRDAVVRWAEDRATACDDLVAFVDGELSHDRAQRFRAHLPTCSKCQEGLVEAQELSARLGTLGAKHHYYQCQRCAQIRCMACEAAAPEGYEGEFETLRWCSKSECIADEATANGVSIEVMKRFKDRVLQACRREAKCVAPSRATNKGDRHG